MTFRRFIASMNQQPSESEDAKKIDGWMNVIAVVIVGIGIGAYLIYAH